MATMLPGIPPATRTAAGALRRRARRRRSAAALAVLSVAALLGVVRQVGFEPFTIASSSMEPALPTGSLVLADKVSWRRSGLHRGDIVLFTGSAQADPGGQPGTVYAKRVVGMAGEFVACCTASGAVTANGVTAPGLEVVPTAAFGPVLVPSASVFVLGDNRNASGDSRGYGPVPTSAVLAVVRAQLWPPGGWPFRS